jgi:hypothetical protein
MKLMHGHSLLCEFGIIWRSGRPCKSHDKQKAERGDSEDLTMHPNHTRIYIMQPEGSQVVPVPDYFQVTHTNKNIRRLETEICIPYRGPSVCTNRHEVINLTLPRTAEHSSCRSVGISPFERRGHDIYRYRSD